jgi:hypothetical protein
MTAPSPTTPAAACAARLAELRDELAEGGRQLAALDQRRAELRDTMLRIAGAIQVLEELSTAAGEGDGATP